MAAYRIASIGGDGVGPEVVAAGRRVLDAVAARDGFSIEWLDIVAGGVAIDTYGTALRTEDLDAVASCDAVLLGAVGGPRWDDPEARVRPEQALFALRGGLELFANLRPVTALPALVPSSPVRPEILEGVDLLIVRELTSGLYFGRPSEQRETPEGRVAIAVGPGLGADSIHAGALASVVGVVLVVIFMIVFYGLFGVFADIALFFNLCIMMAALTVLGATLTLPGIAGIALTMGMAVDANVLIYERIREEVRGGRSLISSLQAGFERAFGTILDSHVTTLVAGALMFWLGSGPVKGFAVTLILGVVTSLFSAILVTRLLIVTWVRRAKPKLLPI